MSPILRFNRTPLGMFRRSPLGARGRANLFRDSMGISDHVIVNMDCLPSITLTFSGVNDAKCGCNTYSSVSSRRVTWLQVDGAYVLPLASSTDTQCVYEDSFAFGSDILKVDFWNGVLACAGARTWEFTGDTIGITITIGRNSRRVHMIETGIDTDPFSPYYGFYPFFYDAAPGPGVAMGIAIPNDQRCHQSGGQCAAGGSVGAGGYATVTA